jgi:HPt (histidine-containing phosphotransfer) domain-containing protein
MSNETLPVFAPEVALERLDQDQALLGEIITLLVEDAPAQLGAIRDERNLHDLERVVHGFRGAVSNVGGVKLTAVLRELEEAARSGRAEQVPRLTQKVEGAWDELFDQLSRWEPS